MRRLVVVQLAMFAVIAAVVIPFGIRFVAGPAGLMPPMTLHATMSDAFGLTKGTTVTVRGVEAGAVSDVRLGPDGTARVTLAIHPGTQIPRDAIMTVGMSTAVGIQSVDILPQTSSGPYLASGDTIEAPADRQPVQMDRVMRDAAALIGSIDVRSVGAVSDELSASFDGLGPSLATLIDNGAGISRRIRDQLGELAPLLEGTARLVTTMAAQGGNFVRGMSAVAGFSGQVNDSGPVLLYLTDHAPATLASVRAVLDTYRNTFGATLANLATVTPIIADRTDSLDTGLTSIPAGLNALASIVKGDRADFALVATQGPVCVFDVDRRAIGDVSPVEPSLVRYCPPTPDTQMRGAVNAPRPNQLGMQNSTAPGEIVGPAVVPDPIKIPTLAELAYKWRMILKGNNVPN
ncbi:MAG: MCE family protein [Mycobacterium sp.]|nr:MCE family protein [Mycobacterium sp.]